MSCQVSTNISSKLWILTLTRLHLKLPVAQVVRRSEPKLLVAPRFTSPTSPRISSVTLPLAFKFRVECGVSVSVILRLAYLSVDYAVRRRLRGKQLPFLVSLCCRCKWKQLRDSKKTPAALLLAKLAALMYDQFILESWDSNLWHFCISMSSKYYSEDILVFQAVCVLSHI